MTTLSEAIKAVDFIRISRHKKSKIADQLLGKYKGVLPKQASSTQVVRQLRDSLHGKIK